MNISNQRRERSLPWKLQDIEKGNKKTVDDAKTLHTPALAELLLWKGPHQQN